MSFHVVATITAIAGCILGLGWIFAGATLFKRWGIDAHIGGLLVGRRLGAVYLAVSIMLFIGRSAPPSDLRVAVCIGMLFAMLVLAGLGLFEFRACRANSLILVSVAIEIILSLGFIGVLANVWQ